MDFLIFFTTGRGGTAGPAGAAVGAAVAVGADADFPTVTVAAAPTAGAAAGVAVDTVGWAEGAGGTTVVAVDTTGAVAGAAAGAVGATEPVVDHDTTLSKLFLRLTTATGVGGCVFTTTGAARDSGASTEALRDCAADPGTLLPTLA
jgi:hypothetical protein